MQQSLNKKDEQIHQLTTHTIALQRTCEQQEQTLEHNDLKTLKELSSEQAEALEYLRNML